MAFGRCLKSPLKAGCVERSLHLAEEEKTHRETRSLIPQEELLEGGEHAGRGHGKANWRAGWRAGYGGGSAAASGAAQLYPQPGRGEMAPKAQGCEKRLTGFLDSQSPQSILDFPR
jgi:hypothetical protein